MKNEEVGSRGYKSRRRIGVGLLIILVAAGRLRVGGRRLMAVRTPYPTGMPPNPVGATPYSRLHF